MLGETCIHITHQISTLFFFCSFFYYPQQLFYDTNWINREWNKKKRQKNIPKTFSIRHFTIKQTKKNQNETEDWIYYIFVYLVFTFFLPKKKLFFNTKFTHRTQQTLQKKKFSFTNSTYFFILRLLNFRFISFSLENLCFRFSVDVAKQ